MELVSGCLIRFAVWQPGAGKWRVIDNGRTAAHNDSLATTERIHTTTAEMGAVAMRRLRRLAGRKLAGPLRPHSSTQDMKKAFRQIPIRERDRAFHVIALVDPSTRTWKFGILWGLAFGLGAAVLEFNRIPIFIVALARRYLAIPCFSFYDDFRLLDIAGSAGNADSAFFDLVSWTKWVLDPAKHQSPGPAITFLGIRELADEVDELDAVRLAATEERRQGILQEIAVALTDKRMPPGGAAHLVGRLIHYASVLPGRIGLGLLSPLSTHARGVNADLAEDTIKALQFHYRILSIPRSRLIPLIGDAFAAVTIITDASWGDAELSPLIGRICFLILGSDPSSLAGGVLDLAPDDQILGYLEERRTQIIAAELLGPVMAAYYRPDLLHNTTASFYIDNMSGMCALVKGSSRKGDLSAIASALHLRMVEIGCKPWFDYVETLSNSADGGSREGCSDPVAEALGIPLTQYPLPALPEDFPFTEPDEWSKWWNRERSRRAGDYH